MMVLTPRGRDVLAGEDGFTLVELLVTMVLAIIVLLAVLLTADGFTRGSAATNRLTEVEDSSRQTIDTMVRTMRDASNSGSTPVKMNTARNLVIKTSGGWRRYCVGGANGAGTGSGALRVGTPVGSYTDPPSACPSGTSAGWTYADLISSGLLEPPDAPPLFSYRTTGSNVNTIFIAFTRTTRDGHTAQLRSSVALRNR